MVRRYPFLILLALGGLTTGPRAVAGQTSDPRIMEKAEIRALAARARTGERLQFTVERAGSAIDVDAQLDEPAWGEAVRVPLPFETNPGDNVPAPVRTECRITFDQEHLYFACIAGDPDPDAIRAYITDRDDIVGHDRVGVTFDPSNDARRAFEFSVSALGVQRDARFDEQEGWDGSWDAIWTSAGRITDTGYVVEAAIPFKSLRFPGGDDVQTWGFFALREWPRSDAVEIQSMFWDRSNSCRLCQANLLTGIQGVSPGVNLEFTPTFTSSRTDRRDQFPNGDLETGSVDADPGFDARWGITPNLQLNATVNPDFSQVEADVAQLDVNNRFALFFPEKRPFFLEGADFFSTPLQAVFTRTIVDPIFGTKLTGKLGANALGTIIARDETNSLTFPGNQGSGGTSLDQNVTSVIGRYRRDIGASNTLGVLYTGREAGAYHNRVAGVDGFLRPFDAFTVRFQYLRSQTAYPDSVAATHDQPTGDFGGNAGRLWLNYSTRNWNVNFNARALDPEFRADAGFINQVDVRGVSAWVNRFFWADEDTWYTQFDVSGGVWHNDDFDGRLTNQGVWANFGYSGPLQSSVWVNPNVSRQFFEGAIHDLTRIWTGFGFRPSGAIRFNVFGNVGDAIDFANAQKAFQIQASPSLDLRLGRHVDLRLSQSFQRQSKNGGHIFTALISQLRAVYNFNPRTFVRAIVQFRDTDRNPDMHRFPVQPERQSVFTQFLFSYKVNPVTALFLGYSDNRLGVTEADLTSTGLTQTNRTFFLKLGYAWRP